LQLALFTSFYSGDKINEMGGECSTHRGDEKYILAGELDAQRPLGRSRCRQDNIEMDLKKISCEGVNWFRMRYTRPAELLSDSQELFYMDNFCRILTMVC
jgi:hypothetical protein